MPSFDVNSLPLWVNGLIVAISILVIAKGAHWVVENASQLAKRLGISELVIGLTVVALGTSAPEFAVTLIAAFKEQGNISVGNVVGSNIFNLGFIMGGAAMFRAIPTNTMLLKRDGAILAGTSALLLVLIGIDLTLNHHDGLILMALLVGYLLLLFKQRKSGQEPEGTETVKLEEGSHAMTRASVLLVVGLVAITGGSHFLVDSATAIARGFGVSEWVIGVTIVAAGTSAPEFATTLVGVMRRRFDISAGNLVGSDIFNLLGVLGLAGTLHPVGVDQMARLSLAALLLMVVMVLVFMRTGWRISRFEGFLLVAVALARWTFDFSTRLP